MAGPGLSGCFHTSNALIVEDYLNETLLQIETKKNG
jgi:hypothetical protein